MYSSDPRQIVTSVEGELVELLVGAEVGEEPVGIVGAEGEPVGAEVEKS